MQQSQFQHSSFVNYFPKDLPISFTHHEFPCNVKLMEDTGMEFGFIITPFIENRLTSFVDVGIKIPRCIKCYGYINPFCEATNLRWYCSLCGQRNEFLRSQTRYRNMDLKRLPETQNILNDYRVPFFLEDPSILKKPKIFDASVRPFVHIFLIQEGMNIDSLKSVIDALSSASNSLHPDIKVILMTFSCRIGIFKLSKNASTPCVQFSHFLHSTNGSISVIEDDTEYGHADPLGYQKEAQLDLSLPLSEVINFYDAAATIGQCRKGFDMGLASIFDMQPIQGTNSDTRIDLQPKAYLEATLHHIRKWMSTHSIPHLSDSFRPIDFCSGVVCHIFMDGGTGQDGSRGMGTSNIRETDINQESEFLEREEGLKTLADSFLEMSFMIQIWSVQNFKCPSVDLDRVAYLSHRTGGSIFNFVLGLEPLKESRRLEESLRKALTRRYASKGIMRVRSSKGIQVNCQTSLTNLSHFQDLKNVFNVPMCTSDSNYCFAMDINSLDGIESICIQMAYSYETLVENNDEASSTVQKDTEAISFDTLINQLGLGYTQQELQEAGFQVSVLPTEGHLVDNNPENKDGNSPQIDSDSPSHHLRLELSNLLNKAPYFLHHAKRLQTMRFLRTFTVMIESTDKVSRIYEQCDLQCYYAFLLKSSCRVNFIGRHFLEGALESRRLLGQPINYVGISEGMLGIFGSEELLKRTLTMLTCYIQFVTLNTKKIFGKNTNYQQVNPIERFQSAESLFAAVVLEPKGFFHKFLLLVFSTLHKYLKVYQNAEDGLNSACELESMLLTSSKNNIITMFQPILLGLNSEFLVDSYFLPLNRASIVTNQYPYYLLYSFFSFVVYSNSNQRLRKALQSAHPSIDHKVSQNSETFRPSATTSSMYQNSLSMSQTPQVQTIHSSFQSHEKNSLVSEQVNESMYSMASRPGNSSEHRDENIKSSRPKTEARKISRIHNSLFEHFHLMNSSQSLTLRLFLAESGTSSAEFFTEALVEEKSDCGLSFNSFKGFLFEFIKENLQMMLND